MGQLMTSSRIFNNNDELINALIKSKTIRSKDIEKVFRCVDRGFYVTDGERNTAYEDSAWQSDSIHLSSPSIYASVLECLRLQRGHKFLNIGSGIGYLNTVAGLLLDVNGVNHGIEINQSVIDLALQKMDEFKLNAAAIDHYNFCEPVFIHGNVCELLSVGYYDRVYCGASVPQEEFAFLRSLINIGGIIVMPVDGCLLKVTRTDEHAWQSERVFEVVFTDLVVPPKNTLNAVKFPSVKPLCLQELCRSAIRSSLRENLKSQFPEFSIRTKCHLKIEEYKGIANENNRSQSCPLFPYNVVNNGGFVRNLVRIVDTFSVLEGALSDDSDFVIDDDSEVEADNNEHRTEENRPEQNSSHHTFTKTSDEPTKRKSPEAENSEQSEAVENPKKMKMNSSSPKSENIPSTSSQNHNESWETVSSGSFRSSLYHSDSESLVSSMDDNFEEIEYPFGRMNELLLVESGEEDSIDNEVSIDSEDARDSVTYRFKNEWKKNELSIHLKEKINSLPIPNSVKRFLNYHRSD